MKKFLIILLAVVLAVGAGVGVFFGVKAHKAKTAETVVNVDLLESEYTQGDKMYLDVQVFSNKEFVSLGYKFNNGETVTFNGVKSGESAEHEDFKNGGKFFIETGVQEISTESMATGYYVLTFYGFDAEGVQTEIAVNPIVIKIVAPAVAD